MRFPFRKASSSAIIIQAIAIFIIAFVIVNVLPYQEGFQTIPSTFPTWVNDFVRNHTIPSWATSTQLAYKDSLKVPMTQALGEVEKSQAVSQQVYIAMLQEVWNRVLLVYTKSKAANRSDSDTLDSMYSEYLSLINNYMIPWSMAAVNKSTLPSIPPSTFTAEAAPAAAAAAPAASTSTSDNNCCTIA